jgi:serralysin
LRFLSVLVASLAASCLLAGANAVAATVSLDPGDPVLVYTASLGEANRLTITESEDLIVVSDPGAAVIAGNGCTSVDAHTAHCANPTPQDLFPVDGFSIDVRDGDDRIALGRGANLALMVVGVRTGNGDDRVSGCRSVIFFDMGRGADRLTLCAVVSASARGGPGPDVLRGGPTGLEQLVGGDGNDVLIGGASGERLQGGLGRDTLLGQRGVDWLEGQAVPDLLRAGPGRDRVMGGAGNDTLRTWDRARDRVDGGSGRDRGVWDGLDSVTAVERFG